MKAQFFNEMQASRHDSMVYYSERIGLISKPSYSWLRKAVLVVASIMLLTINVAFGKGAADRDWIEVRTSNFRVFSALNEKKTIELARYLEMFRVAIAIITNISSTEARIPTNIVVFRNSKDFVEAGGNSDTVGIFLTDLRANTMVMLSSRMAETTVILHEYEHFLLHNNNSLHYPKWFDEGFAEYLSAVRTRRGEFDIGLPPSRLTNWLNFEAWLSIEKILSPDGYEKWRDEKVFSFYAQSWLLVHYLMNRPEKGPEFTQDMSRYLDLMESGSGSVESFEKAFGLSAKQLRKEVKRYFRINRYRYIKFKAENLIPNFAPDVIALTKPQSALRLGQLALRLEEWEKASEWFAMATASKVTRPRAEAGLGRLQKKKGDLDAARIHFEKAVFLAPEDPYSHLEIAKYWHSRARDIADVNERSNSLQLARRAYTAAWKLDDSIPEVYAMFGQTYSMDGSDYAKAVEMLEEAQYLLPSNLGIRLMLAEAYAGANRRNDALKAARSVLAWSHKEGEAAARAKKLVAALETAEK